MESKLILFYNRLKLEHAEVMKLEKGAKVNKYLDKGEFCAPTKFEFVRPQDSSTFEN